MKLGISRAGIRALGEAGKSTWGVGSTALSAVHTDAKESVSLKLQLSSSATLDLVCGGIPVACANMALSFYGQLKAEAVLATFSVNDILVKDKYTLHPAIEDILTIKPGVARDESMPYFSITYDYVSHRRSVVRASALPLQFVLNEYCLQQLLGFFALSSLQENSSGSSSGGVGSSSVPLGHSKLALGKSSFSSSPGKDTRRGLAAAAVGIESAIKGLASACHIDLAALLANTNRGLEVIFEAETPKIIIPEQSMIKNTGYGLFDAGYLVVRGFLSLDGMVWDISLGAVNAGMPLSIDDMYRFGEQSLYLIKPFDIKVSECVSELLGELVSE